MVKSLLLTLFCFFMNTRVTARHFSNSAQLPGDIMVGGLFTAYFGENGQCQEISPTSVQVAEAVKWIFNKLNNNTYIPGVKIGLLALPTCRLTSEGNNRAFELITDMKNRQLGHYNDTTQPIVGIIGPEFSSIAQSTSQIFSSLPLKDRLLQIGISTTASILDDKSVYQNFYKVITSDVIQVKVMIGLMKKLQWNHIAVVYENDTYGIEMARLINQTVNSEGICVAASYTVSLYSNKVSVQEVSDIISGIKRKNINGVVFIGNDNTANTLLIASKNSQFSENVQFIFSEAVDLKVDVFQQSNQILDSGKGTYIVSPTMLNMDDFSTYWKSIFTDINKFKSEAKTNSWLVDVFESYTNCRPDVNAVSLGCAAMTLNAIEEKYTESISISYAVRAALLMAKVISDVYHDYCTNNQPGLCPAFKDVVLNNKGVLLSKIQNININFQTDFPFNITEFEQNDLGLRVVNGQVEYLPSTFPKYEVYQYRNCYNPDSQFCLIQVGNYTTETLNVDESFIRDYSVNTITGTQWPDISRAACKAGTKCTTCIQSALADEVFFDDGDFIVVGISPVYDKGSTALECGSIRTSFGLELVEAMKYAVQKINEKSGEFANYFRNKKIGLLILNSCNQPLILQNKITNIYENGVRVDRNGTLINIADRILGFIGAYGSDISIAAAQVLSKLGYVQVSYASTASVLSDRITYPYFMRVATPDNEQAKLMVKLVKELNSNYIQIVHSAETYGIGGRDSILQAANSSQVCIANDISVEEGVYNTVLDTLRKNPFAKIVIVFIRSHMMADFMKEMNDNMDYGEFLFIGTEGWGKNMAVIKGNKKLKGSLSLSQEMIEEEGFTKYLQNLNPLTYVKNPWFQTYFETKYQCYFKSSYDKGSPKTGLCDANLRLASSADYHQELWTPFVINAMLGFVMGASQAFDNICGSTAPELCSDYTRQPDKVVEKVKAQKLDISGRGKEALFNPNGDGSVGYSIYNVQEDPNNRQNLLYKQIGSSTLGDRFEFKSLQLVYPDNYQSPSVCPNELKCKICFPEEDTNSAPQSGNSAVTGLGVFVGILLVIIILLVIALLVTIRRLRRVKRNNNDSYLNPYHNKYKSDGADYYSEVSEDQMQMNPFPPPRNQTAEAQGVVNTALSDSANVATSRVSDPYLAPSTSVENFNNTEKIPTRTYIKDTANEQVKNSSPKISGASI